MFLRASSRTSSALQADPHMTRRSCGMSSKAVATPLTLTDSAPSTSACHHTRGEIMRTSQKALVVSTLGIAVLLVGCSSGTTDLSSTGPADQATSSSPSPAAPVRTPSPVSTLPAGISQANVDAVFGAFESDQASTCRNWGGGGSNLYVQLMASVASKSGGTKDAWMVLITNWLQENC